MKIGVPKETLRHEHRVGLTPFGVSKLVDLGHDVFVQSDAGAAAHFADADYAQAGATIVYNADEVFGRADVVAKVGALSADEMALLRAETTILGFHHLAVAGKEVVQAMVDRRLTMIGYEICEDARGGRPVLAALSEIAGHMVIHVAGHLLETSQGGRGVLLGGVAGVAPATVLVLGAGVVGRTAASHLLALGAHVILLDSDLAKLRDAIERGCHDAVTAVSSPRNILRFAPVADVVVGAVLVPGGRAPFLIGEEMVKSMKSGSVIIDLAVDQGGCVETSRPTTPEQPTYKVHGVTHYCVPNMTTNVPRSASRALGLAALPLITRLAESGPEAALRADAGLARGAYSFRGRMVNELAAKALGLAPSRLNDLLP
ncbi:MAG: alanine dehydrogenase [Candidatus Polarisedimenticolia bacterium]|nr:alanine dehydrogenase [bacterium]